MPRRPRDRRLEWIDLADEKRFVAAAFDRLGDKPPRRALTVHLGGIDQRAAEVQTQLMRCDLLRAWHDFRPYAKCLERAPGPFCRR
jgi:hypothetical protein